MTSTKNLNRILCAVTVSTFGNWLTFIAIALLIGERFGAAKVAYAFLVQGLPPLLFSHKVSQWTNRFHRGRLYAGLEILGALNVLSLLFSQSIIHIYIYLFIAATIRTITNPLFNSFVKDWIEPEHMTSAFRQVGAVSSFTLAAGPALGGTISAYFGYEMLFVTDAVLLVLAVSFVFPLLKGTSPASPQVATPTRFQVLPSFEPNLNQVIWIWFALILVGAWLNGIEFPVLFAAGFDKVQIGTVLSSWGLGSLASIVVTRRGIQLSAPVLIATMTLGLAGFVVSRDLIVTCLSFVIGGCAYVLFSGALKARIQNEISENEDSVKVWSYVNQGVNLINVLTYYGLGLLIEKTPLGWLGFGLILLSVFLLGISVRYLGGPSAEFKKESKYEVRS